MVTSPYRNPDGGLNDLALSLKAELERRDLALGHVTGRRIDPETGQIVDVPEAEHFYTCHCGQTVDKRDLGQVLHHMEERHEPMRRDG